MIIIISVHISAVGSTPIERFFFACNMTRSFHDPLSFLNEHRSDSGALFAADSGINENKKHACQTR